MCINALGNFSYKLVIWSFFTIRQLIQGLLSDMNGELISNWFYAYLKSRSSEKSALSRNEAKHRNADGVSCLCQRLCRYFDEKPEDEKLQAVVNLFQELYRIIENSRLHGKTGPKPQC